MKPCPPTINERAQLYKKLLACFENGESPGFAAKKLKINIKTAYKYYQDFREKMLERVDNDFINRQRTVKEFTLAALDEDLEKLQKQYDELLVLCEDDPENSSWQSIRLQVIIKMAELRQQKADLEMSPTLDISLDQMVDERINEQKPGGAATPSTVPRD